MKIHLIRCILINIFKFKYENDYIIITTEILLYTKGSQYINFKYL